MTIVKAFSLMLLPIWLLLVAPASYGASNAAMLIDADTGNVLFEQQAHRSWYPASLTKVMTLYMTFEALKSRRIGLYDDMEASAHASAQPNSKLGLRRGEYITVENAILALVTRSANDAAVVLAEHLGGTEENFAIKMTAKAHSLGMYNTHFMNATGLPHDWQVTTARDMAVMAWRVKRNFPEYYQYFSAHSMNFRGTELRAINKFTSNYPGAEGMKTGFTCGSGYNLIGAASQDGRHLIGVILGGMSSSERYELMMDMMDQGFAGQLGAADNITAIPTSSAGIPPYQLGCGRRHNGVIAHNDEPDDGAVISQTRYKRPSQHHAVPHLAYAKPATHKASRAVPVRLAKPAHIKLAKAHPVHSKAAAKVSKQLAHKAAKEPVKMARQATKPSKLAKATAVKVANKAKPVAKTKPAKVVAKAIKKTKRG